jgi:tRNA (guanine37-N1)-methyltransferase
MPSKLKALLDDILSPEEKGYIFSSYDIIGDIIIIKIPDLLLYKKYAIGKRLLESTKSAKSVFLQTSSVDGDFRLRKLELLAGTDQRETEHKEYGCRFAVDVSQVYFSPRLSTERHRIARRAKDNEIITNMFAGVGTFSIMIAKHNPQSRVFSIDSNPRASFFCNINVRLNKVQDRVFPLCGDAGYIAGKILSGISHRVLMPLPERAKVFVDSAVACLRYPGGTVHFFAHVQGENKKDAIDNAILNTTDSFKRYDHIISSTRVVREVGPRLYQTVSDVAVLK